MVATLHVYPGGVPATLPVEREPPQPARDESCSRCALCHVKNKARCLTAEATGQGGVLLLTDHPTADDDRSARPLAGEVGNYVRSLAKEHVVGDVAFDCAVRCAPRSAPVTPAYVSACRGYLTAALAELQPTRILALGRVAALALTGRAPPPLSARGGYCHTSAGTPVFFLMNPLDALRNKFLRGWFEEDFRRALTSKPPQAPWKAEARVVESLKDAQAAEADLLRARWFAVDAEWSGYPFRFLKVLCVSCAPVGADYAWVWDVRALESVPEATVLGRLMASPRAKKAGQNFKSDTLALRTGLGFDMAGVFSDARLMRKVLDPDSDANLELMQELVGMGGSKEEAHVAVEEACKTVRVVAAGNAGKKLTKPASKRYAEARQVLPPELLANIREGDRPKAFAYALVPRSVLYRYNAADAISTARLVALLEDRLIDREEADFVWQDLVRPGIHAVARMEEWGIAVDRSRVEAFQTILNQQLIPIRKRLDAYDPNLNPDSPKQVAALLYDRLKLPVPYESDGGAPSTEDAALKQLKLAHPHPVLDEIVEWRRVTKLRGTYAAGEDGLGGLLAHIRADGRVHPSINLDGARSGRTSCSDPNCQNIPRADSAEGKLARDCFVASPGHQLVQLDYSQLELRIAAALSGDPVMKADFLSGEDFHLRTAKSISKLFWGIEPEKVTKAHRSAAKSINFGLAYGKTPRTFADELKIPIAEAERICTLILGRFKVFDRWRKDRLHYAKHHGYSWTEWKGRCARQRWLTDIAGQDDYKRSVAEHGSYNTPVQGSASDYCVASIVAVVRWIEDSGFDPGSVMLVLPVHDSLMLDVREDLVPEVTSEVRRIMLSWPVPYDVPLEADCEVGPSWGSLKKYAPTEKAEGSAQV